MTRPDREALRAWDRAVLALRLAEMRGPMRKRALTALGPKCRLYWAAMYDCQLAGLAAPFEVAFGGRA